MNSVRSYQDIKTPPEWDEPSVDDYFEMFYSEYCGKEDYSDEDYEIIRRWWYEFKGGTGCPYNEDIDTSIEEMKEQLADFDKRRDKHSCETCERCVNGICEEKWKHYCRTGNNDDYTLTDYYIKRMSREDWEKLKWEKQNKINGLFFEKYKLKRENRLLGERCNQLLKDKGDLTDQIADIKANCDLAIEGRDVKIMELEKENAELKKELKDVDEKVVHLACNQNKDLKYKLTKAKEIMQELIHEISVFYIATDRTVVSPTVKEAEQFLKEVEE